MPPEIPIRPCSPSAMCMMMSSRFSGVIGAGRISGINARYMRIPEPRIGDTGNRWRFISVRTVTSVLFRALSPRRKLAS